MYGFEYGYRRAIAEIFGGIVTSALVDALLLSGIITPSLILYIKLLNMISLVTLILAMPYWGTGYLIGWLFGLLLMARSGLVNIIELIIYTIIPVAVLLIRVMKFFEI